MSLGPRMFTFSNHPRDVLRLTSPTPSPTNVKCLWDVYVFTLHPKRTTLSPPPPPQKYRSQN